MDALQNMLSSNLKTKRVWNGIDEIGNRAQDGVDIEAANFMSYQGANINAILPKGLQVESDLSGGIGRVF